jgi:hypothetical protein
MSKQPHHGYDKALKLLFSHPIMIESLIRGFVPESWVELLNFKKLRKLNVKHITEDLREREDDLIWQLDFKGQPLYLLCLLEFQSDNEEFMAVRILTYAGLIYQDLLKNQKQLLIEGKLPPLFSFVFYTGSSAWRAPTSLNECMTNAIPPGLRKYQPNIEYMVLDIGRYPLTEYTIPKENLVSSFIAFEQVRKKTELRPLIKHLQNQLKGEEYNSLRKAFYIYIKRVWKARTRFPEKIFNELDGDSMLIDRIQQWEEELYQEGLERGLEQGLERELELSLMLLEYKFPNAPKKVKNALNKASKKELDVLANKIMKAKSVEEILC